MFVLIDNYDSFTYNLYHYLGELGAEFAVHRNDQITVDEIKALHPQGIVISPGPCDPDRAGICLELIESLGEELPILGVCLGHQAIGQAFGGKVVRADKPMHGKTSSVQHEGVGIFEGLPSPITSTRYHSLTLERDSFPAALEITAESEDGTIMGIRHPDLPLFGVQFHPESIASEHGHDLLRNFLTISGHNG